MTTHETLTVWAKTTFVGWHYWPDAPAERAYLRDSHRHLFHVSAELEVGHDDREVEFHDLMRVVERSLEMIGDPVEWGLGGRNLGPRSCEAVARWVADAVARTYPGRLLSIEVSEDNECGARLMLDTAASVGDAPPVE